MDLLAVLVAHDRAFRGARVCAQHYSVLEQASTNSGARLHGPGHLKAALLDELIATTC